VVKAALAADSALDPEDVELTVDCVPCHETKLDCASEQSMATVASTSDNPSTCVSSEV